MGRRTNTFHGGIISVTNYPKKYTCSLKKQTEIEEKKTVVEKKPVVEEKKVEVFIAGPDPDFLLVEVAKPEKSYCNIQ